MFGLTKRSTDESPIHTDTEQLAQDFFREYRDQLVTHEFKERVTCGAVSALAIPMARSALPRQGDNDFIDALASAFCNSSMGLPHYIVIVRKFYFGNPTINIKWYPTR